MKYIQIFLLIFVLHTVTASLLKVWDENEEERKLNSNSDELKLNTHLLKLRERADSTALPPCNEDQLMMYLAEIQAINPEDIINLSTFEDIKNLCKQVSGSITKMDTYMKTCDPPQQKDLYIQLIKGVNALYDKLCKEGQFKKDFEQHYKCYHELHNDLQDCNGPADWTEDEDNQKVCKAYRDIADCYYTKTAKLCGIEAANLIKELILAVINSVLIINCEGVRKNPKVVEPMPEEPKEKNRSNNILPKNLLTQINIHYLQLLLFVILLFN